MRHLRQLAIGEIAVGKGHHYLTVALAPLTWAVVFVGNGKGVEVLQPFWPRLRRARAKVAAVATEMSPAYTRAVRQPTGYGVRQLNKRSWEK